MAHKSQTDLVLSVPCSEENPSTWALNAPGRNSFRILVRCRSAQSAADPRETPGLPSQGGKDVGSIPSRREKQYWPLHGLKGLLARKTFMKNVRNSFTHTRPFRFIKAVLLTILVAFLVLLAFWVFSAGLAVG